MIWGRPAKKVNAQYVTADNKIKTSILLASGWWVLSCYFHSVASFRRKDCSFFEMDVIVRFDVEAEL